VIGENAVSKSSRHGTRHRGGLSNVKVSTDVIHRYFKFIRQMATLTSRTVYAAVMRSMLACDSDRVTVTLRTIEIYRFLCCEQSRVQC